ncbi:MAG TPA: hypothetical protein VHO25_05295 [Polyangiaceae bacterium]|nr:hypothetical protein [Polyangiaceae bacterium]
MRISLISGCLIAACHSGEPRDLQQIEQGPSIPDAGSDASLDGASPEPNEAGPVGGAGNDTHTDVPDAGDAEAGAVIEAGTVVEAGPPCGDGHTDLALGEECDDGNNQHSDGCEIDCKKTRIVQMALGRLFTCALSSGGGVKCWGGDTESFGALGRGTSGADVTDPMPIDVLDFGTSRRVTKLSASWDHVCVVFEDERARCWGFNYSGQLGIGTQLHYGDDLDEPLNALPDLPITGVKDIVASSNNTCLISDATGANNLYCWGFNRYGTLGIGSTVDKSTADINDPAQLNAEPQQFALEGSASCVIYDEGQVRCFGAHGSGELGCGLIDFDIGDGIGDGNGLGQLPDNPLLDVKGLPGPTSAIIGTGNTATFCALIVGQLYCWGQMPVEVWEATGPLNLGDVSVTQAAFSDLHGCALDDHGVVRCWGNDEDREGVLGYPGYSHAGGAREPVADYQLMRDLFVDAGPTDGSAPTESLPLGAVDIGDFDGIPGLDPATYVWVGYRSSCALMQNGGVRCWGKNNFNRLGYGIAVPHIGYAQSPAELYAQVGFSDIKVFGPRP